MKRPPLLSALAAAGSIAFSPAVKASPLEDLARSATYELETGVIITSTNQPAGSARLSANSSTRLPGDLLFSIGGYASLTLPDPVQQGGPALPGDTADHPRYVELTALNLSRTQEWGTVVAGKADLAVGVAELYAPTDRFDSRDYSDPFHSKRLGRWQMRADVPIGDDTATVVVLPVEEVDRLPDAGSPWALAGNSPLFRWSSIAAEHGTAALAQTGVLARYAAVRDGYDFFLGGHYGPGAYPTIRLQSGSLVKAWPDALSVFAGAVATVDNWRIHGEALFQHSLNGADEDFVRMSIGASVRLTAWASLLGVEEITPTVEFHNDLTTSNNLSPAVVFSSSAIRPFPSTILAKTRVKIDSEWGAFIMVTQNVLDGDYTRLLGADYQISDNTQVSAVAGVVGGPEGSQFGYWGDARFLMLSVSHKF
jgi:hypothetical protein